MNVTVGQNWPHVTPKDLVSTYITQLKHLKLGFIDTNGAETYMKPATPDNHFI